MPRIVVASGKGGTGKTTIATSLALSLDSSRTLLIDCDVEAPNAHLFLQPRLERREEVGMLIPEVDAPRCTACGRCAEVCAYHAVVVIGKRVLVLPQLCHGCGSCAYNCPEQAIRERLDVMGVLEAGPTPSGVCFARGMMQVGEAMASPIIRQLKRWAGDGTSACRQAAQAGLHPDASSDGQPIVILDAPPGVSCPVVETLRGADFALLVTEPTPFGLHDLRLMVDVTRELHIPAGIVINRDGVGDGQVEAYCAAVDLPVLLRIPLERSIGEGIARGEPLVAIRPAYVASFQQLYACVESILMETER